MWKTVWQNTKPSKAFNHASSRCVQFQSKHASLNNQNLSFSPNGSRDYPSPGDAPSWCRLAEPSGPPWGALKIGHQRKSRMPRQPYPQNIRWWCAPGWPGPQFVSKDKNVWWCSKHTCSLFSPSLPFWRSPTHRLYAGSLFHKDLLSISSEAALLIKDKTKFIP